MFTDLFRRLGVLTYAAVLVAGAVAVTWKPSPLLAQETKCFLVVCTGNVCVYEQVTCPPPPPIPD